MPADQLLVPHTMHALLRKNYVFLHIIEGFSRTLSPEKRQHSCNATRCKRSCNPSRLRLVVVVSECYGSKMVQGLSWVVRSWTENHATFVRLATKVSLRRKLMELLLTKTLNTISSPIKRARLNTYGQMGRGSILLQAGMVLDADEKARLAEQAAQLNLAHELRKLKK